MTDTTPSAPVDAATTCGPADITLIGRARDGDVDAYGPLFDRHHGAALALARRLTRSADEADDVAAEAFDRVMRAVQNGKGPTEAFRPYLLTAVRRVAWRRSDRADREVGVEDEATLEFLAPMTGGTADEATDHALAVDAFSQLPERWQLVLWHTLVEDKKPADVAPLLGISPNATAALAVRAREGLREAFLQGHLNASVPDECRFTVDRLGARVRDNLGKRDRARVQDHLEACGRCRQLEEELGAVNGLMRSVIGPAVLGVGVADYRSGWPEVADLSARHIGSFGKALAVGAAGVVALATLGLRADLEHDSPPTRIVYAEPNPSAGVDVVPVTDPGTEPSGLPELLEHGAPITPVVDDGCPGPILPLDLDPGMTVLGARAVVTRMGEDASALTDDVVNGRPIGERAAALLANAVGATPMITSDGVCAESLIGDLGGLGLLLRTSDDDGLLGLMLVDDLLSEVVGVLQSTIERVEAGLSGLQPDDPLGEPPTSTSTLPTTPRLPVPDLPSLPGATPRPPAATTPPAVAPPSELPGVDLPDLRDLLDGLTSGGLL